MNKILKSLVRFSTKERLKIQEDIKLITERNIKNLDTKKLKGFDNLYRARRGKVRIIFYMDERKVEIIKIDKRNDNTYKSGIIRK
jgi:mRNA-degrading endonuclease RelE of RelBE toxin-antitoxin system